MVEELLAVLELYGVQDVREMTISELEQICVNPVFRILCDVCDHFYPNRKSTLKEVK